MKNWVRDGISVAGGCRAGTGVRGTKRKGSSYFKKGDCPGRFDVIRYQLINREGVAGASS